MAIPDSFVSTLKHMAGKQERGRLQLLGVAKTLELAQNLVAWQVAVVSPGFLGPLWNAEQLSNNTRLPREWFLGAFVGAEILFLLAIVSAVMLHSALTNLNAGLTWRAHLMAQAKGIADDAGVSDAAGEDIVTRFRELEAQLADATSQPADLPWWFPALSAHPYLTVGGYVLMGFLLAAFKFK